MVIALFEKFERNQIFTEDEGWMLFRLAAIGEACGWTLLISGMAITRYILPGNNIPVMIAGQFHGILFLLYAAAAAGLYPTLRWSRKQALVALMASVPPYGSLLFEIWARHRFDSSEFRRYAYCIAFTLLSDEHT